MGKSRSGNPNSSSNDDRAQKAEERALSLSCGRAGIPAKEEGETLKAPQKTGQAEECALI